MNDLFRLVDNQLPIKLQNFELFNWMVFSNLKWPNLASLLWVFENSELSPRLHSFSRLFEPFELLLNYSLNNIQIEKTSLKIWIENFTEIFTENCTETFAEDFIEKFSLQNFAAEHRWVHHSALSNRSVIVLISRTDGRSLRTLRFRRKATALIRHLPSLRWLFNG